MKNKHLIAAAFLGVIAFFAIGAMTPQLEGLLPLYRTNPLLLSITDSSGDPEHSGRVIHKFGRNAEPTAADDVWDCSEAAIGGPAVYPFQSSAYTLYASSDNAGDTTQTVTVEGLDANWERAKVDVDLNGLTFVQVGTASNWLRVFRAYNSSATVFAGNIYLIDDPTDVGADGIPDNIATLQACIQIGNEQTLMAIYTTADDERTWITQWCANILDDVPATAGYTTTIPLMRANDPSTLTFRVQTTFNLATAGTSDRCEPFNPPLYVPKRTDIKFNIDAMANITDVTATFNMLTLED
jgi:hypothetical protein